MPFTGRGDYNSSAYNSIAFNAASHISVVGAIVQPVGVIAAVITIPLILSGGMTQAVGVIAATGQCSTPLNATGSIKQPVGVIAGFAKCQTVSVTKLTDTQGLAPGALWVGYKLDCSSIDGSVYYFSSNVNQLGQPVVWQGQTYTPIPITVSGFEASTSGSLPTPTLSVSNLDGLLGALVASLDDLCGAIVTRYQVLTKYLDAVNYTGGVNALADPTGGYNPDVWVIEQKTAETQTYLTFKLNALYDANGLKLPARMIQTSSCPFAYANSDGTGLCPYSGSLPSCDRGLKTSNGCVTHFGSGVPLPFGGFPGAQRTGTGA